MAGNVVWQWDNSDPFGNNPPNENPSGQGTFTNNLGYPGQYRDRETNTFYNINRDYDPAIGRYIESDPVGLAGGINTFGYVGGNPLSWVDPLGLDRLINPMPAGPSGPRITFNNDLPGGPSTNLPVSDATADMIERAVIETGLDININSTTGGSHDPHSRHSSGMAIDINRVCGMDVNQNNDLARRIQEALNEQSNIRENYGPFITTKTIDGEVFQRPDQAGGHTTHIHASGQM